MAVAVGGAVLVAALAMAEDRADGAHGQVLLEAAILYEWAFWAAAGVLAMTGIGNIAAFGGGLPSTDSEWGVTFQIKLLSVIALVTLSLPRTLAIAQLAGLATDGLSRAGNRTLLLIYAGTVAAFAAILALAILMAHR